MYDSTTARFMQEDTFTGNDNDPLTLNLYTYCNNEPIMYVDPTGHFPANAGDEVDSPKQSSSQASNAKKGNTAIVNVSSGNLNVRSGGGTDNSIIGKLSKGA